MSAIIPAVDFDMHAARSKLIDTYNEVDLAVRKRLKGQGGREKAIVSENLESLSKIPAGPQYSKSDKKRVDELIVQFRDLQPLRCDVVHGKMEIVSVDGVAHALFVNVQKSSLFGRCGLLLSKAEFDSCSDRMTEIARGLAP